MARSKEDNLTIHDAEFYPNGNRARKTVSNAGPNDGTQVYYYDSNKVCALYDGSGNLLSEFIHGTQYIDELVMVRVKDKGELYYHQDANWNVVAMTDLAGQVMERYAYTPYGDMVVNQENSWANRDGDEDIDSTDKGTPGTTCSGPLTTGSCKIMDLDYDGDYDNVDGTKFDNLPQGLARHPSRLASNLSQPFGHQGLLYDPEISSYQNRARQYTPALKRFAQRDPIVYRDGMNVYAYLGCHPAGSSDPTGLVRFCNVACDFLGPGDSPGTPDTLNFLAKTICCMEFTDQYCPPGAPVLCGIRCKAKTCWHSQRDPSSRVWQCLEVHEEYHRSTSINCDFHYEIPGEHCPGAAGACGQGTKSFSEIIYGECQAHRREYNCLRESTETLRCNYIHCITERWCGSNPPESRDEVLQAEAACVQQAQQGQGPGCTAPEYPIE